MPALIDYEIVVPSRDRVDRMPNILERLPGCTVFVHEKERDKYAAVVPESQIRTHTDVRSIGEVRQRILDTSDKECVVMIDDDFDRVWSLIGRSCRGITEPEAIRTVIENGINVSVDLGIPLFGWSATGNLEYIRPTHFITLNKTPISAWGLIGREFRFDLSLTHAEDADLALQVLLRKRITLCDTRFWFCCGQHWSGTGGLQGGTRTSESQARSIEQVKRRWGRYVSFPKTAKKGQSFSLTMNVPRRSDLATK